MTTKFVQFETVLRKGVPCLYVPQHEIDALIERLPADLAPVAAVLKVLAHYVPDILDETKSALGGFAIELTKLSDLASCSLEEKIALQLCAMLGDALPQTVLHHLAESRPNCGSLNVFDEQALEDMGAPDVALDFEIWDDLSD